MGNRLDWEKANRRDKKRKRPKGKSRRAKQEDHVRQQAMFQFVFKHQLACFKCGEQSSVSRWARTGFSKRGPWAMCDVCVKKR